MKKSNKIIATVLICGLSLSSLSMFVQASSSSTNDALAVINSSITLEQAVTIAKKTVAGTPTKAQFSTDDGIALWEVEVIDIHQQVFDIEIDAKSGKVLKHVADKTDDDDDEDEKNGHECEHEDNN